ncbi:MAG TPA: hypothetical protein VGD54_00740 [Steroidobacteraceae bacterium]
MERITEGGKTVRCGITEAEAEKTCGAQVKTPILGETEEHRDKWCDDAFHSVEGCPANKQMFNHSQREGARCGVLQLNHIQHIYFQCSCVSYNAFAMCRSGEVGIDEARLAMYGKSQDKRERAVNSFVAVLRDGLSKQLVSQDAQNRMRELVLTGYGASSYAPKLLAGAKKLNKVLRKLEEDNKKGNKQLSLSYAEVAAVLR